MFLDATDSPLLDFAVRFDECTDDDATDDFQFLVKQGRHWLHHQVVQLRSTRKRRGRCAINTDRRGLKVGHRTTWQLVAVMLDRSSKLG